MEQNFRTTVGTSPLHCNIHDFETDDVNAWNEHCSTTEGHTLEGECLCSAGCGNTVVFKDIPYQPITPKGFNLELKCEDCYNKADDLNARLYRNKNTGVVEQ